jgi:hypothetical protein
MNDATLLPSGDTADTPTGRNLDVTHILVRADERIRVADSVLGRLHAVRDAAAELYRLGGDGRDNIGELFERAIIHHGLTADDVQTALTQGIDAFGDRTATAAATRSTESSIAGRDKADTAALPAPTSLPLKFFDELQTVTPKDWLIKNVLASGETSAWIGRPGAGKSALLTDIAIHLGACDTWRGYRIKRTRTGVVYFALERADLVGRRLVAHRMRDGIANAPIALVGCVIDLLSKDCASVMVDTIRRTEDHYGCGVGLAIIDTYAKGIAAGGGDENSARDQNRALVNLRRLIEQTGVHVATIGHTGKDESKGERGSNAKIADVDMQVTITGDQTKCAEITKGNDVQLGDLTAFALEPFEFGADDDGDPYRTHIVSKDALVASTAEPQTKLTANQRTMFSILHDAGSAGLLTDEWNEKAKAAGIGVRRRATLHDIRSNLKSKGLVREFNDRWFVQHH